MPIITQVFSVIRFLKSVLFGLFDWGDLLLFFGAIMIVFFSFIYSVFNFIYYTLTQKPLSDMRVVQITIFDVFYLVILEAILKIFVCTYSCRYDPNNPPESPYPPYDLYTDISCTSTQHILLFSIGIVSLGYYHWRASHFIVKEEWKNKSANESALPDKFRYAECIMRVCFCFLSLFLAFHHSLIHFLSMYLHSSMYLFPLFSSIGTHSYS